jgi:hypothetical protein
LLAARTEFCAFLDADDQWHDDHLATLCGAVLEHPEAAMWFSGSVRITDTGHFAGRVIPGVDSRPVRVTDLLLGVARPTTSATLVRREAVLRIGGFDEHPDFLPASCEDLDLWLRLAEFHELRSVSATTVSYRVSDDRRLAATRRANQRARVRTVQRALANARIHGVQRREIWAATFADLGKWNLKHGTHVSARRCFATALAQAPWHAAPLAWMLLAVMPESGPKKIRQVVRMVRGLGVDVHNDT